jgi:pyridoxal phosphate phosphatase PHOSPHO2
MEASIEIVSDKTLVVFDFDATLIELETYQEIPKLLTNDNSEIVVKMMQSSGRSWYDFNDLLFEKFREEGIQVEKIKDLVQTLELNKNFMHLLKYLEANKDKYSLVIISGTLEMFIQWILEKNQISHLFDKIYSHRGNVSEQNFIEFVRRDYKSCSNCTYSLCKANILEGLRLEKQFNKVYYVGDGMIDYCASLILLEEDILFPRKDFPLFKTLYVENQIEKIRCKNIFSWEDGLCILKNLKEHEEVSEKTKFTNKY